MYSLESLYDALLALKKDIAAKTRERCEGLAQIEAEEVRLSRLNLLDYLHLRERDLSALQPALMQAGLASLSRVEMGVMHTLDSMLYLLAKALNRPVDNSIVCQQDALCSLDLDSVGILQARALQLFGPPSVGRDTRIMVTLPTEAAWSDALVADLLQQGMNIARINTAHDDPDLWRAMVENVRRLAKERQQVCRVMVDLTGPKLRTGLIASEPAALRIRVKRNLLGITTEPGKVLLYAESRPLNQRLPSLEEYQMLPVPDAFLSRFKSGDKLVFKDSRGKKREIVLVESHGPFFWKAICFKPAYLEPQCEVAWLRRGRHHRYRLQASFVLSHWQGAEVTLQVFKGDYLLLSATPEPADWTELFFNGQWRQMARISCQLPEPLANLSLGDPVWFDDGKLGCKVVARHEDGVILQATDAGLRGVRLKADKGINFPQTDLGMSGLSAADRAHLDWICEQADMVGLSFVQSQEDIERLLAELGQRGREQMPIIAKIETAQGLHSLPDILLKSLGRMPLGVMIARGDLAVELGSVRMAEMQEEILTLCEAAHVPVVWATQVLETLARKGVTSRPELTDAAVSVRSECVMLNKGPYIADAVRVLSDILCGMQHRTRKKVSLLKPLRWDTL